MQDMSILKEATILYAEDELLVRESITSILRRRVKSVYTADNGKDALDIFKEKQDNINLVITDIEMPIMNGLELIESIKKIRKKAPVIIITAFDDEAHNSDLADFFIVKPVKKEVLFDAMIESVKKFQKS